MKKKKNSPTIRKVLLRATLFLAFLLIVLIADIIACSYMYIRTGEDRFTSLLLYTAIPLGVIFLILTILFLVRAYHLFYYGIVGTTLTNMKKISRHEGGLVEYKNGLEETEELTSAIEDVNVELANSSLISITNHYSKIPLVFTDEKNGVIDHHSFHSQMKNLIQVSQSYRNVLLELYYDITDGLSDEEIQNRLHLLGEEFRDYDGLLFSVTEDRTGIYIYLPHIDSFSALTERIAAITKQVALIRKDDTGRGHAVGAKFAEVCYPYSNVDELFPDIHYAKRMGKTINIYLPERMMNRRSSNIMASATMSLNNLSNLLASVSNLSLSDRDQFEVGHHIQDSFLAMTNYLRIEQGGILLKDSDLEASRSYVSASQKTKNVFPIGSTIEKGFLQSLDDVADSDDTYYVSTRTHTNYQIATYFDRLGIRSGFFYRVRESDGSLLGIVYFLNREKNMFIDSYLRETILSFSKLIGNFLLSQRRAAELREEQRMANQILVLSNTSVYRVNSRTYQLTSMSQTLLEQFPKARIGDCCYKVLYGESSPCAGCPLSTKSKMLSKINGNPMETALTLNIDERKNEKTLYLKKLTAAKSLGNMSKSAVTMGDDLYDTNLLIHSFYSLHLDLDNAFQTHGKGYLLLLKIDNIRSLILENGSEGVSLGLRKFIDSLIESNLKATYYLFRSDTIALLFPEAGQIDVLNAAETIYLKSKDPIFPESRHKNLFITYLPIVYPQVYSTSDDYVKHCQAELLNSKYTSGLDFLYFDTSDYKRPASRVSYMLDIIQEKFSNNTFNVLLQPMLLARNQRIDGGELLVRVTDDYRKVAFNTDELIRVAIQYGKIGLISDALLKYISDMYLQYGNSIFRVFGFQHLAMNTEYSYLSSKEFLPKITSMVEMNLIPKNFLTFEVSEQDVGNNEEGLLPIIRNLHRAGFTIEADGYTGKYVSLEKLQELGFDGVKIDRSLVRVLDTNRNQFLNVKNLLAAAKLHQLKITLIGIENMEQYHIVHDIDPTCYIQGYAFYKPLEKNAFIDAIQKNNSFHRE